jgi:hypothetical protein
MLIIIEGCDNTGKSTLAKHLMDVFSLQYVHCNKPQGKTRKEILAEYLSLYDGIRFPTVVDRGHFGEFVYSNLWRKGCLLTPSDYELIDNFIKDKFGFAVVIHAKANFSDIVDRCRINKEQLLSIHDIEKCCNMFDFIMGISKIPVIEYNSSIEKPEDLSSFLCNMEL